MANGIASTAVIFTAAPPERGRDGGESRRQDVDDGIDDGVVTAARQARASSMVPPSARSRNTTPCKRQRAHRSGHHGDAEAGGDQRQQHGGARRRVFAVRHEPGALAAAQHRVVDRGVAAGVRDERLAAQIGQRHHGLDGQPVVDRHREHQRLDVDGAQLDVLADRGRTQHAEVEGAGAQLLALRRE